MISLRTIVLVALIIPTTTARAEQSPKVEDQAAAPATVVARATMHRSESTVDIPSVQSDWGTSRRHAHSVMELELER